jgi:hypothetical protein
MKTIKYILLATLALGLTSFSQSSAATSKHKDKDSLNIEPLDRFTFFNSEDVLEMTLMFDVREFQKTKLDPDKSFDAKLTVVTSEKDSLSQEIKIKARGKMRRKYCSFPPICLKIKDGKGSQSVFETGNLKLVTHCSPGVNFENYILKEYLVYKLYNQVTPYSFKARLVRVNYVDAERPKAIYTEYGFLIENTDNLASRNNASVIENPNISQNNMDEYEMARVAIFNYMIGNTDWSVQSQHNIKVLKTNDPTINKGIPVSYDFDYSGFVHSAYATPNEKIPINDVTERYFQGTCFSESLVKQVFDEFQQDQPMLIQTIETFNLLPKSQRKMAETYVNNFFKKYRKENVLISDINRTCLRNP